MSVQAISAALALQGVTWSEKLLLIVLANYADDEFKCWPSQATLASNTGFTDRGIRKLLTSLIAKGYIRKRGRHSKTGQTSDLITLLLPPPEPRSATGPRKGASGSATPRNHVPPPPEPRSDEPTIEPSLEPSTRERARDDLNGRASLAVEERDPAIAAGLRDLVSLIGEKRFEPPRRRHARR